MEKEKIFKYAFQIVIVLCFFAVVLILLTSEVPKANETVLNLVIGALIGSYLTTVNYSFSSTADSAKKTDIIARSTPVDPGFYDTKITKETKTTEESKE